MSSENEVMPQTGNDVGLIVGQPEAGAIISEWPQVAIPTASGSSTIRQERYLVNQSLNQLPLLAARPSYRSNLHFDHAAHRKTYA